MSKEIEVYCKNRITNKGERIGLTDKQEEVIVIIDDYINSIGLKIDLTEVSVGHGGCFVYRMKGISHLVFISREEDSKYDFY